MNKKIVGIIILNWNSPETTFRCIKSLLNIDNIDSVKIYVVDNGSKLVNREKLRKFLSEIRERCSLEFIQSEVNLGFGCGNNLAIREIMKTNLKYIWLLNNDTLLEKDALHKMLDFLDENNDVGAVGSKLIHLDDGTVQALGGGQVNLDLGIGQHILHESELDRLDYLTAASMLIRREVLERIEGFDKKIFLYWEDVELSLRIVQAGWKLGVASESIIYHEESSSSKRLGAKRQFYFTQGLNVVIKKHTKHNYLYRISLNIMRAINKIRQRNYSEAKAIWDYLISDANNNYEQ